MIFSVRKSLVSLLKNPLALPSGFLFVYIKIVSKVSLVIKKGFIVAVFALVPFALISLISANTDLLSGMKSFVVISGSMEPDIPTGSIIYTVVKDYYAVNDVIAFNQKSRVITHRIVGIETVGDEIFYRTKGDANDIEDSQLISKNEIVGETITVVPLMGKIIMAFKTPTGFAAGIVLPAIVYILMEIGNIRRNERVLAVN